MKRLLLLGALLSASLLGVQDICSAHGGTYRGPGDTVPPGGGGGGGGGGPATPGPGGPSSPGPSGPSSPGPASPGAPAGNPGSGPSKPTTSGGGGGGVDLTVWDFWWGFNKDPYLNLKSKIHDEGVLTGSDDFFLGQGQESQAKDSLRPSEEQIRGQVVPALLRALEKERSNDILTGAMIALAKIGDVQNESGESEFEKTIAAFLKDGNQEVSETAAVALGILANDASVPALVSLMNDDPVGRQLVGNKTEVPYRTRAFAAYGLGLVGHKTSSNEVRQDIVKNLVAMLNGPHFSTRDVKVAAMTAMGLTPVELADDVAALEATFEGADEKAACCLQSQLSFLIDYIDPAKERANKTTRHYFVRAHAPTAMARLLTHVPDDQLADLKAPVYEMLAGLVGQHSKAKEQVQQSTTLAFGIMGDSDADEVDTELRENLGRLIKDGDRQTNRFALIALAQVAGNPGENEKALEGVKDARAELLKQLSKGRTLKPWAALALGVFGRALLDNDQALDAAAGSALRTATAEMKRPSDAGAYCLALGLRRDNEGKKILLDKLDFFKGSNEARGYAAVGLGLMEDRSSIEPIQEIIKNAKYRPDLLKQAAIALGLLGDKELVPELIDMLGTAKGLATQAAISSALGAIGDSRSIDPLITMLDDKSVTDTARGFSAVALGIVCDKEPLPWNSKVSTSINYRANTTTLTGENGTGILDIL
ncbi:MAG: HEAT repeat protein [Planctomycetota bacterium]|jgi:HEAT repeat protein